MASLERSTSQGFGIANQKCGLPMPESKSSKGIFDIMARIDHPRDRFSHACTLIFPPSDLISQKNQKTTDTALYYRVLRSSSSVFTIVEMKPASILSDASAWPQSARYLVLGSDDQDLPANFGTIFHSCDQISAEKSQSESTVW